MRIWRNQGTSSVNADRLADRPALPDGRLRRVVKRQGDGGVVRIGAPDGQRGWLLKLPFKEAFDRI